MPSDSMIHLFTLAQGDAKVPAGAPGTETAPVLGPGPSGGQAAPSGPGLTFMVPIALVFGVMILMQVMAGKKENRKRAELISSLRKQDKVITTAGILGTVLDVGDDTVLLRVEEGKIRVSKSSVQQVVQASNAKEKAGSRNDGGEGTEASITEPKTQGQTARA